MKFDNILPGINDVHLSNFVNGIRYENKSVYRIEFNQDTILEKDFILEPFSGRILE